MYRVSSRLEALHAMHALGHALAPHSTILFRTKINRIPVQYLGSTNTPRGPALAHGLTSPSLTGNYCSTRVTPKQRKVLSIIQPTIQPTIQPITNQQSTINNQQSTINNQQSTTNQPTNQPTIHPSIQPANRPATQPTIQPTSQPTNHPSIQPTNQPTTFHAMFSRYVGSF